MNSLGSLKQHARRLLPPLFILGIGTLSACGDDSDDGDAANVAGSYEINTVNGSSNCEFDWDEGATNSDIPLSVTQSGNKVTAQVEGLAAVAFALVLGTTEFKGTVRGDDFELTAHGTRTQTQGNCTTTLNAIIEGTIDGDAISGTITYRPASNDNPDCKDVEACAATQTFNGIRPPS